MYFLKKDGFIQFINILGSQERLSIIRTLLEQENVTIMDLADATQLTQDVIEDHLHYLKNLKLIFIRWLNKTKFYAINQENCEKGGLVELVQIL